MDPEPKSLRPFILVATFFVILGCVATYFFWLLELKESGGASRARAFGGSSLHPVAFLAATPPADRERLTGYVVTILGAPGGGAGGRGDWDAAFVGLVAGGEAAVPPLLDALYRLSLGTGFESKEARATLGRVERVLDAVAKPLDANGGAPPPGVPPRAANPADGGDAADASVAADAADAIRRAEAWFRWWESRQAAARG